VKYLEQKAGRISAYALGTTGFWYGMDGSLKDTILTGIREYGINAVDTAQMYGNGNSEKAVAEILQEAGRDNVFLIDKILPSSCTPSSFDSALNHSLQLLKTDVIDLYLLHWRENCDLSFLVRAMNQAQKEGKIKAWGVSNFDTQDLKDLFQIPGSENCTCNQILCNPLMRGAEFDLIPCMQERNILPVSYCSLGSRQSKRDAFTQHPFIQKLASDNHVSPEGIMLACNIAHGFCALFSTSSPVHLRTDLSCVNFEITPYLKEIDSLFPIPDHKVPLAKY
jgi:diketogulonate reductase-like aldo/keto reductase